jgi:lipoprotein-releasing system permease protein
MLFKPLSLSLSLNYLFSRKNKANYTISLFTILGVSMGICALIIISSVMGNLTGSKLKDMFTNPHIVSKNEIKNKYVKNVFDYYNMEILLKTKNKTRLVEVAAYSKLTEKFKKNLFNHSKDLENFDNEKYKIILPREYVEYISDRIYIGAYVYLVNINKMRYTPLGSFPLKIKFQIAGFYKGVQYNPTLYISQESFKKLTNDEDYFNKEMELFNPFDIDKFDQELIKKSWLTVVGDRYSTIIMEKNIIYIFAFSIVLISLINLYSSLNILVNEKRKDISMLKSMGYSNNIIYRIFLLKGLLNSFLGSFIGSIFGILFVSYFNEIISFFEIKNLNIKLIINYQEIIILNIIVLLLSVFISTYPAYKAIKIKSSKELSCE